MNSLKVAVFAGLIGVAWQGQALDHYYKCGSWTCVDRQTCTLWDLDAEWDPSCVPPVPCEGCKVVDVPPPLHHQPPALACNLLPRICYQSHVAYQGGKWLPLICNGSTSGTIAQYRDMQAIRIATEGLPKKCKLKYQVHVAYKGWLKTSDEGKMAGTMGESRPMEAIKIWLEDCPSYDVAYQIHQSHDGWEGWLRNGDMAGTIGQKPTVADRYFQIEAIQIQLVDKKLDDKRCTAPQNPDKFFDR